MKQDPKLDIIQQYMVPGEISRIGFLGNDPRKLVDILLEDGETITHLGLTHALVADTMDRLALAGRETYGNPVLVDDYLEIIVEDSRGSMACPFHHPGMYPKENVYAVNTKTGESISWTALNTHMIRDHGFYEGVGSPFRVEPLQLIKVLEIKKMDT